MEWRNQVAVVTGGSRGIGRATARLFAQRGAAVCVNYAMHADAAEALVAEITTAGGRAIAVAADVADSAAVEAMIAHTEAELGPVTILVNNAGVSWQGTLDTYDREQVARMHQVNVDGVIHATRAVIGSMRAQRYGRIVNVASIAGIGTALSGNAFYARRGADSHAALCPRAGSALHHGERCGSRVRPHRTDAARPWRSGLAGDGATLRSTSDDGPHWRT
jgi:3-oxoacyl-[acyl-carrier protein] reductase